jgi:hypothetical protein
MERGPGVRKEGNQCSQQNRSVGDRFRRKSDPPPPPPSAAPLPQPPPHRRDVTGQGRYSLRSGVEDLGQPPNKGVRPQLLPSLYQVTRAPDIPLHLRDVRGGI